MSELQLVHKIVFFDNGPKACILMAKFVESGKMDEIQFRMGVALKGHPEEVTMEDFDRLKTEGIPVTPESFDIFFNKKDYDQHDLLDDSDTSVAIRIKD